MWIVPCYTEGDLMCVRLADNQRAGLFEFFDYERVPFGNIL